jgi:hypothetical protein
LDEAAAARALPRELFLEDPGDLALAHARANPLVGLLDREVGAPGGVADEGLLSSADLTVRSASKAAVPSSIFAGSPARAP